VNGNVKLWADDKKRKKTILEQQYQLQQQQQWQPEQPNKEKEVIAITTRIQEEQPKVNLHTSTRNLEVKN
jgi:hypothetical protein